MCSGCLAPDVCEPCWTPSHVPRQSWDFTSLFKPHLASTQQWYPSYSHLALPCFTSQTFWSVPNQLLHSPSHFLPPSIFHKRTVTNLFECSLRYGRRDGWADRGGGGLVSGMVASSFTAYISHTLADCWCVCVRGGLGEIVYGGLERGEGGIVCELHACLSECVSERERERQTESGGGYSENWRSKFIIVMAFSGIHFPVVCWQLVVSACHPPPPLPPSPCMIDGTGLQPNRPGYTLQRWTHVHTNTNIQNLRFLLTRNILCIVSWMKLIEVKQDKALEDVTLGF